MKHWISVAILCGAVTLGCQSQVDRNGGEETNVIPAVDSTLLVEEQAPDTLSKREISLTEELLFKDYYLEPTYAYKDTTRSLKLEQIKEKLAYVENLEEEIGQWAVVRNYRNMNGEAPTVEKYVRDAYKRVSDTLGVERYQSAPLYNLNDTTKAQIYARDGWLVHLVDSVGSFYHITPIRNEWGDFYIPRKYVRPLGTFKSFPYVIFVDRGDQKR